MNTDLLVSFPGCIEILISQQATRGRSTLSNVCSIGTIPIQHVGDILSRLGKTHVSGHMLLVAVEEQNAWYHSM